MKHTLLIFLLSFATLHPGRAWDPVGHMIVAQIAYDHLTPRARQAVDASLAAFNRKKHTGYTPVIAACWMDDIRGDTKEYNPWHYINLPFTPDGKPFPPESERNVLSGINLCVEILKRKASYKGVDRDQALVMLTHLVGDVHQPLHTTSRADDLGGNKVDVPNLEDPELAIFNKTGNLHWFWDEAYRMTFEDGKVVPIYTAPLYSRSQPLEGHRKALGLVREKADSLEKKFPPSSLPLVGTPETWVSESHALGYSLGYQKLPGGEAANPVDLDQAYVDEARAAAEQRLVLAGYRLAHLLNGIY